MIVVWVLDILSALCITSALLLFIRLAHLFILDVLAEWRAVRRQQVDPLVKAFAYCDRRAAFVPLIVGFCDELAVSEVVFSREGSKVEVYLYLRWWGVLAWWNRPRLQAKASALLEAGGIQPLPSNSPAR